MLAHGHHQRVLGALAAGVGGHHLQVVDADVLLGAQGEDLLLDAGLADGVAGGCTRFFCYTSNTIQMDWITNISNTAEQQFSIYIGFYCINY